MQIPFKYIALSWGHWSVSPLVWKITPRCRFLIRIRFKAVSNRVEVQLQLINHWIGNTDQELTFNSNFSGKRSKKHLPIVIRLLLGNSYPHLPWKNGTQSSIELNWKWAGRGHGVLNSFCWHCLFTEEKYSRDDDIPKGYLTQYINLPFTLVANVDAMRYGMCTWKPVVVSVSRRTLEQLSPVTGMDI